MRHRRMSEFQPAAAREEGVAFGMAEFVAFLRAHRRAVASATALGVGLAGLFAAASAPLYTARAQLVISQRAAPTAPSGSPLAAIDTAQIESEIAVMRSERVAELAVREVDPEVAGRPALLPLRAWIVAALRLDGEAIADPFLIARRKLDVVATSLTVRRLGLSHAIELAYVSGRPEHAAAMANAIAAAFINERIAAREESARESGRWLERRVEELREQMGEANTRAQKRRAQRDYRIPNPADPADATSLEELESLAASYTKTYESYLQALTDNAQRQALSGAEARVITRATAAAPKTYPRLSLILALGALAGALGGVALAFVREGLHRTARSAADVSAGAELECVGVLPTISTRGRGRPGGGGSPLFEVAVAPFSAFSDSLKRVQTALAIFDREAPTRRLGVVSAMSGEGKSTFLCNLAQLLAASGLRTVIVDADLRKPTLSRALASHAKHGLLDALRAPQEDLARFIAPTAFERVDLLPSVGEAPVASHDLLGSPATAQLLDRLAARYDFVLVDLPPLSLLPDGYAIGHLLDGMLLVARWNVAPMDTLREVAVGLRACGANTLGAVLTGVESLARRGYAPPYAPPASAA